MKGTRARLLAASLCWPLCALLLAPGLLAAPDAQAQAGASSEDVVKAAYLSKLRHYVEWPPRAAPPAGGRTVIGIVGADEVAARLAQLAAVRDPVKGTLAVRQLRNGDPLDGIHILYVGDGYVARAAPMIEQAAARSILVVTESDGALAHGSVINFRVLDERVRFEISLDSAGKAGLRVSSQLLVLASSIVKDKR
jgi:hypothetical protein